jgi:hypothetical protein
MTDTLTTLEWREFFEGDLKNLARIQQLEDVDDDNGHMKNRVRFSARLAEAYKIAGPVLLARISGQVVQMLRMWIDSKTALPGPNLVQSAWIKWVLQEVKQTLPAIGSAVTGQQIVDLRRLAALIEQEYSSDYGVMLENPIDGHQAEEYDLLAETRLNEYWQKVRNFNRSPTEENADAIERDPHLQKILRVNKPCKKTAVHVMGLRTSRRAGWRDPGSKEVAYYQRNYSKCLFDPQVDGRRPIGRIAGQFRL